MKSKLIILVLIFSTAELQAQTFATTQSNGTTGTCVGCEVQNPSFSVDADPGTYSLLNLTVSTSGSSVFQDLVFPITASTPSFVGVIIEADNLIEVTEEIIAGLTLTSFDGVTPNTTKSASELTIAPFGSGTQYILEYTEPSAFDRIQIKLSPSVLPAAVNTLRVYNGYHNSSTLPVEFVSFSARTTLENVILDWVTAQELNNDYFIIQHSRDGLMFDNIGRVNGKGTTNELSTYLYEDQQPDPGSNYYRLAQVDLDGTTDYSETISAYYQSSLHVYPNPSDSFINIQLTIKEEVNISILDLTGTTRYLQKYIPNDRSSLQIDLNPMNLPTGIYNLVVRSTSGQQIRRLQIN